MDVETNTAAAIMAGVAQTGPRPDPLRRAGDLQRMEAFELGYLAGALAHRPHNRTAPACVPSDGAAQGADRDAEPGRAVPPTLFGASAAAYEQLAERLERYVAVAELRAERHGTADRRDAQAAERGRAAHARDTAERAHANARQLRMRERGRTPVDGPVLTPREVEVLGLVSHGLTYAEAADQLHVTAATVKTHLAHIYSKLGVSDKAAAVGVALRHGLMS